MKFRCYSPDDQSEEDARVVEAFDSKDAAESFAERRFYRGAEYPTLQQVVVLDAGPEPKRYEVETAMSPTFTAREK